MRLISEKGFTLLELLVSVALGAILLSIGVPSYSSFVKNSRQVSSANELISDLHLARELAITRNRRITVCPSSTGEDCEAAKWADGWIVFADDDGDGSVDAGEQVDRVFAGAVAPSVSSAKFDAFLLYRPNGRAMVDNIRDNTGEFTLCDDRGSEHARVVVVDLSGRPRVSRERLDGGTPVCPS